MYEIDTGGKSMSSTQKKLYFIVFVGVLIFLVSGICFWQKNNVHEEAVTDTAALNQEKKHNEEHAEKSDTAVVYVCGAVKNPGVYTISADARIKDVINSAGGFAYDADVTKVNLAQKIKDGMQINVIAKSEIDSIVKVSDKKNNGKININTATKSELDSLPKIGPAAAQRIIEYREQNGGFKDIDELKKVHGISASTIEKLRDKITL